MKIATILQLIPDVSLTRGMPNRSPCVNHRLPSCEFTRQMCPCNQGHSKAYRQRCLDCWFGIEPKRPPESLDDQKAVHESINQTTSLNELILDDLSEEYGTGRGERRQVNRHHRTSSFSTASLISCASIYTVLKIADRTIRSVPCGTMASTGEIPQLTIRSSPTAKS